MILNAMTLVPGRMLVPINFRLLKVMYAILLSRKRSENELRSILKRAYFTLQEDCENDFRRRIDTKICEHISLSKY